MNRQFFMLLLPVLLTGCSLFGKDEAPTLGPDEKLVIETDASVYQTSDDFFSVPLVITNKTSLPLYLTGNLENPFLIPQKKINGEWVTIYSIAIFPETTFSRLSVAESLPTTSGISDLWSRSSWRVQTELPGTYRFVVFASFSKDADDLIPLEKRVSNEFEIIP